MVMLDPPYFPSAAFDKNRRQSIFDWQLVAKECERVLAKSGVVVLWGNQPRLMDHFQKYFTEAFRVQGEVIWVKTAPNLIISQHRPMPQHEDAWILVRHKDPLTLNLARTAKQSVNGKLTLGSSKKTTRGGPRQPETGSYAKTRSKYENLASQQGGKIHYGIGHYLSTVITTRPIHGGHPEYLGHPTQKALDVVKPLISLATKPGNRILDPFAGSGTTLVAAEMMGGDSLGIELNAAFCKLTRERLDAWNGKPL